MALLGQKEMAYGEMVAALIEANYSRADAEDLIRELRAVRGIVSDEIREAPLAPPAPPEDYPLQALVLNVTNQCNLACTYCYEFGADKIATPAGKPGGTAMAFQPITAKSLGPPDSATVGTSG